MEHWTIDQLLEKLVTLGMCYKEYDDKCDDEHLNKINFMINEVKSEIKDRMEAK